MHELKRGGSERHAIRVIVKVIMRWGGLASYRGGGFATESQEQAHAM